MRQLLLQGDRLERRDVLQRLMAYPMVTRALDLWRDRESIGLIETRTTCKVPGQRSFLALGARLPLSLCSFLPALHQLLPEAIHLHVVHRLQAQTAVDRVPLGADRSVGLPLRAPLEAFEVVQLLRLVHTWLCFAAIRSVEAFHRAPVVSPVVVVHREPCSEAKISLPQRL